MFKKENLGQPDKPIVATQMNPPIEYQESPWRFNSPIYDKRTSDFIVAGNDYGVGHKSGESKFERMPKGVRCTYDKED